MHLYLHIPFCHEICPYCSFYKHKPGNTSQTAFIEALLKELSWQTKHYGITEFQTVYLGGGTPSLLSPTHLEQLFTGLAPFLSNAQEVTLEANPSTFNLRKAELIRSLGVNRVSLGVQSFDPAQLSVLGRDHTREHAIESYHLLRQAGIPQVSIDLMFATPGQTLESWRETLQTAITLAPDHLSCYNLTYEEDTAYFQKFLDGDFTDEPEINESLFNLADEMLTQAGFLHYETSNYAQPGLSSIHNHGYWSGNPYLGIGPSAVGCINRQRYQNIPDTAKYIQQVSTTGHAMHEHENLDNDAWRLERLALELRTAKGCSTTYLAPADPTPLIEHGLITIQDDRIKTTARGAALVDSIVEYLA